MKTVVISIRPGKMAKILNGEKTIEVRKSFPKTPCRVLFRCTKGGKKLVYRRFKETGRYATKKKTLGHEYNGEIVAEFTLERVETIFWERDYLNPYIKDEYFLSTCSLSNDQLKRMACLEDAELDNYIGYSGGDFGYAWYISNLKIFDEPKTLADCGLRRAPRGWGYAKCSKI